MNASPAGEGFGPSDNVLARADELFQLDRQRNFERVDRIFAKLMVGQWVFGILLALLVSPYTYTPAGRSLHLHVYLAIFLGGAISAFPIALAILRPGRPSTRYVIAGAQMLWSALLIHISGGRIETHFHIFGSLALIAFYRDWKALVPATTVVALDHFVRGVLMPESVYGGVPNPEWWRFLEHAGWVLFENTFLTLSCIHGAREMLAIARRQAEVEALSEADRVKSLELDAALRDVTGLNGQMRTQLAERERAQKEIAWLTEERELILNNAADGIVGLDLSGRTTFMNRAASEMTGWTVEELTLRPDSPHQILHRTGPDGPPCRSQECSLARAFASSTRFHAPEEWLAHKDGAIFPAEIRVSPMWAHGGAHVGIVLTFHDISDRREIDRIRQLDRLKDEFISTVSHELRTPLTSIRGALGLLQGGMLRTVPEKGERMLEIAVSNTDRLVRLINDILDVERLDSGRAELERKPVEVRRLMEQALDVMQPMADKGGVTLQIRPYARTIFVDEDRLLQVLTNLLSNAIKFSPAGSTIVVSAEPADGSLSFTVRDQGRGIPADKLETVFERFRQVDASDARDKGGSGLGLSICRSIVQQHGGTIWAERVPSGGTLFRFTIPLHDEATVIEQQQNVLAAAVRPDRRDARPVR